MKLKVSYMMLLMMCVMILLCACESHEFSDIKVNSLDGKELIIDSDSNIAKNAPI